MESQQSGEKTQGKQTPPSSENNNIEDREREIINTSSFKASSRLNVKIIDKVYSNKLEITKIYITRTATIQF